MLKHCRIHLIEVLQQQDLSHTEGNHEPTFHEGKELPLLFFAARVAGLELLEDMF